MPRFLHALIFTLFVLPVSHCLGLTTPELSLSTTNLFAAPGQVIDVIASGGDATSGISLGLEIGDGDSVVDEPVFVSLDFSPSPFDDVGHVEGNNGPLVGKENLIEAFITATSPNDEFAHDGVIARLLIDASGFAPGEQFPFLWNWSTNLPGAATTSFVIDDQEIIATPSDLILTVIPEPTSCCLLMFSSLASIVCKKRTR